MLRRLVHALDGQEQEFMFLLECAQKDQCVPLKPGAPRNSHGDTTLLSIESQYDWIGTLNAVADHSTDEVVVRLAETIVSLTALIDNANSDESMSSFRRARAMCWIEIADYIDVGTPNGQLCACACRQAGELDQRAVSTP